MQKVRAHLLHLKGHAVQFCPKTASESAKQKLIDLEKTLEAVKEAKKNTNKRQTAAAVNPRDMATAAFIRASVSSSSVVTGSNDDLPPTQSAKNIFYSTIPPRPPVWQSTLGESWRPALKEEVDVAVARFFYHDHIAFNAAR